MARQVEVTCGRCGYVYVVDSAAIVAGIWKRCPRCKTLRGIVAVAQPDARAEG